MNAHAIVDDRALPLALAIAFGMNVLLLFVIALAKMRRERREAYATRVRDELTERLIEALESGNADVPLPRPKTLAGQTALDTVVSLIAALKGDARDVLIELLERTRYVDYLQRLLRARSAATRMKAASLLGGARSRRALPALARALNDDPSAEVRIAAAEAIGAIGDPPSVELLLTAARQPTRFQELRIASVIARMGAVAVPALERTLEEDDTRLVILVLDILADIGMIEDTMRVRRLLKHRSPEVRARAAALLGAAGIIDAVGDLIFASSDPLWFVRLRIVKALAALGVPDTRIAEDRYYDALTHLLYDEVWLVRRNAAAALAAAGERGEKILRSVDSDVARSALHLNELHRGHAVTSVL